MIFNWGPCARRAKKLEWVDRPDISDEELALCLKFNEFINRRCGGKRIILRFLQRASRHWTRKKTVSILDMNCGGGDISQGIVDWARRGRWDVKILAVDQYGRIAQHARAQHAGVPEIIFDVREFSDKSFLQAQQFDYVVSSHTLHHLPVEKIVPFLKTVDLLARCGFVLTDWQRDLRGLALLSSVSKFWKDEVIRHDAPLAVQRGFTIPEVKKLLDEGGLRYALVTNYMGVRFSVSSDRGLSFASGFRPVTGLVGT